ncbi:MAG: F0F1 ATP synthase subunit delta [Proteobacteria bacterium]|nr:F0F1 ATP synthase subunit delta [Pseudomonadota bacterium]
MATDNLTIARPYANAAFEFADENNSFSEWSRFLNVAAQICLDSKVVSLMNNPRVTEEQLYELFSSVCESTLNEKTRNFLQWLTHNKRLAVLPEIATLFEIYRAEKEKTAEVVIKSVLPLSDHEIQSLTVALKKRLRREISLKCEIDKDLIGGILIRAGDVVIDGSVSSKLAALKNQMMAEEVRR